MSHSQFECPIPEELREQIFQELPCGLFLAGMDERLSLVYANERYYRMMGYPGAAEAKADGLLGALDRVEQKTGAEARARLRRLMESQEQTAALELKLCRGDGEPLWCMLLARRTEGSAGLWICVLTDISAQKRIEEELRVREEEYRIAVRQSDKLVLRYDIAERTAHLPPESAKMFQKSTIRDLPAHLEASGSIHPDSLEAFRELHALVASGAQPTGSAVLQMNLCCDKSGFEWYRVVYSLIFLEDGRPGQAVISLQNVTQQHAREIAYQRWEKTYAAMPQGSTAYLEFDLTQSRLDVQKGALLPPIAERFRDSMEEAMRYFLQHYVHAEDRERIRAFAAREYLLTAYFRGARLEKQEYRHRGEDGKYAWVRMSIQMLPDPYSCNVRASILLRDIDAQKCEELTLMDQLRTDTLTGALNRGAFLEAAAAVFAQPRNAGLHALVMVDVDRFKRINDRYGHGCGDRVLARICDVLRNALRADDVVGRLGGDEFALLLRNVASVEALQGKLDALRAQICAQLSEELCVTCSFGAAACPQDGISFDELYWKADAALYAAKEGGRNCARIYEADMGRPQPLFETMLL